MEIVKGNFTGNASSMASALATIKENLPELLEYQAIVAQVQKARFDALVEEGFERDAAVELSKQVL